MNVAKSIFYNVFRNIGGGKRLAVLINAYFDESAEGNSKDGLLSVSGYVLDMGGAKGLIMEWQAMCTKYRIPYFHMNECNARAGVFVYLTKNECDQCAREAIRIARKYSLHGHAFILDQSQYREILQDQGFDCDPYSFMVWNAYIHVHRWIHENRPDCKISLFFESGYKTQQRANELLQAVSQDDWGGRNRLASFSFVDKRDSEPAQAADLVVWHIRKGYENLRCGKPIRKDTNAIVKDQKILTIDWTAELLRNTRDQFLEKSGTPQCAARTIFSQDQIVSGESH